MPQRAACLLLALLAAPCLTLAATPASQDFADAVALRPDPVRGERLFVTCAGCHRADGRGNRDGSVPAIAGQHRRVLLRLLTDYRHARRWDPRMQHYAEAHVLPDMQAVADVADHIAGLERGTNAGTGGGNRLQLGRALFGERCASCHGQRGEGDAATLVPRIAGQHHAYLLRLFKEAAEGARPSYPPDHISLFQELGAERLDAIADAASRMQP
ncbi:MAG: c-type cytochrome [Pseudomonadota bacterium]|nr:c-type cytochrome [Pseudomonadota bacterium]